MKLNVRAILRYTPLTILGLCLVHLAARIVAGFATLYNVYSPSETASSIFWMGFWEFSYTNDRYTPEMNAIQPMDVIAPHLGIAITLAFAIGVVVAVKYYGRATAERKEKIGLAISITALLVSFIALYARMTATY